jgi:Uma2 family endonuclease
LLVGVKTKPRRTAADERGGLAVGDLVACYAPFMLSSDWLADLAPERVRPLRRVEYERLVEAGFFEDEPTRPLKRVEYEWLVSEGAFDDERIELLDGVIVEMSPQDPRHSSTVARLAEVLIRAVSAEMQVRSQLPFGASDESLPEPDIAVVPRRDYDQAHPRQAYLIVEVANSSVRKDRSIKGGVYARAGVPEYWVVDVVERRVELRSRPKDGSYASATLAQPGDVVRVASLGGLAIAVDDFLR